MFSGQNDFCRSLAHPGSSGSRSWSSVFFWDGTLKTGFLLEEGGCCSGTLFAWDLLLHRPNAFLSSASREDISEEELNGSRLLLEDDGEAEELDVLVCVGEDDEVLLKYLFSSLSIEEQVVETLIGEYLNPFLTLKCEDDRRLLSFNINEPTECLSFLVGE